MADLQTCEETTSKLRSEVENCISEVNASGGDSDVRSSANGLTGGGLSGKASTAADAVSKARTTFANRLRNHYNGIYKRHQPAQGGRRRSSLHPQERPQLTYVRHR